MRQGARFPFICRLHKPQEFTNILKAKPRANKWVSLYVMENNLPYSRLGLIVSKKTFPKAVERNRVKRRIRESFRVVANQFNSPVDIIVKPTRYTGKNELSGFGDSLRNLFIGLF